MLCTSTIQLRALVVRFASIHTSVQRSPEHPGPNNCVTCRREIQVSHTTWRGHCLGLTEGLRNVSVVLTLHQHQQIVSCTTLCPLFARHPSSNPNQQRVIRFVRSSRSNQSSNCHHSTGSHPHSSAHPVPTTSTSLNRCARHCHQVARVQQWDSFVTVLMTMMMHHAQQLQTLYVAWKPRVKQVQSCVQQTSHFSCLGQHQILRFPDSCTGVGI